MTNKMKIKKMDGTTKTIESKTETTETNETNEPKLRKIHSFQSRTERTKTEFPIENSEQWNWDFYQKRPKKNSSDFGRKLSSDLTGFFTFHLQENSLIISEFLNRTFKIQDTSLELRPNISRGKLILRTMTGKTLTLSLESEIKPNQILGLTESLLKDSKPSPLPDDRKLLDSDLQSQIRKLF